MKKRSAASRDGFPVVRTRAPVEARICDHFRGDEAEPPELLPPPGTECAGQHLEAAHHPRRRPAHRVGTAVPSKASVITTRPPDGETPTRRPHHPAHRPRRR
jgi:hypothetical protein